MRKEEHILVIRLSALGDCAISAPLVKEYARRNPSVKFYMLSQPRYKAMFDGVENLEFIPFNTNKNAEDYCGGPLSIIRRALAISRKYRITEVADLHDVLRTKLIRSALALKFIKTRKIDKRRKERESLCRLENKILRPIVKSQRCMEEVFVKLGLEDLDFTSKGTIREKPAGSNEIRRIGIAPFAGHKGKAWPLDHMETTIKSLIANPFNRIYLYGGGDKETAVLKRWAEKYPNTQLVAGKHSLKEELDSMSMLNVMISMDSANMHLASLAGTPVVCIWGATHPFAGYNGWRQNPENAIQVPMECRPCSIFGSKPCYREDYACLFRVTPDMVLKRVYEILNEKPEDR